MFNLAETFKLIDVPIASHSFRKGSAQEVFDALFDVLNQYGWDHGKPFMCHFA